MYYEIEKILAHKKKKNKSGKFDHLIKIKWKGYKRATKEPKASSRHTDHGSGAFGTRTFQY